MSDKIATEVTVVGTWQLCICLLLGTAYLFVGFIWFSADGIALATGGGGNVPWFGLAASVLLMLWGGFFFAGVVLATLLLKHDAASFRRALYFLGIAIVVPFLPVNSHLLPGKMLSWLPIVCATVNIASLIFLTLPEVKTLFVTPTGLTFREKRVLGAFIGLILVVGLCFAVKGDLDWHRRSAAERQERAQVDREILAQFKNHARVPVMVMCRLQTAIHSPNPAFTLALNKAETQKSVVEPLGPEMTVYRLHKWDQQNYWFAGEVTQQGYNLLKRNPNVYRVSLDIVWPAFDHQGIVPVRVNYTTRTDGEPPDLSDRPMGPVTIQVNKDFALTRIIKPLGADGCQSYMFSKSRPGDTIYVKVTRDGYRRLLSNSFVLFTAYARQQP